MIQPSDARSALVETEARSDPLSGSLIPIEKPSSPRQMAGRKRSRCSSVPNLRITFPVWRSATQWWPTGAPHLSISSTTINRSTAVRTEPPHSFARAIPTQPLAAIFKEKSLSFRAAIPRHGSCEPGGNSSERNSRTSRWRWSSASVSSVGVKRMILILRTGDEEVNLTSQPTA